MSNNKKRGRLNKKQHLELHEFMIKCFEDDLYAPTAARKAGVDRKTAYKHYNQIVEQCLENDNEDLRTRQKRDRIQRIASLDKDIEEYTDLLERVRAYQKLHLTLKKSIPNHFIRDEIDIIKNRSDVKDRKAAYLVKPTLEEAYSERKAELASKKSKEDDTRDGAT
jgi:hypothetical protein